MRTMRVLSTMIAAGVQGVVYDRSHAVVPDAEVMLVNNATGFRRSVNTPADGDYIFTSLHKADSRHHQQYGAPQPEPDRRAAEVLIRPTRLAKCNLHFISA